MEEGETLPETSHTLIASNYKENGTLITDIITWLPFVFFVNCSKDQFFRCLYLIKVIRISKALDKFDIVTIMNQLKAFSKK